MRLADVLASRAGLQQAKLRLGLTLIGFGPLHGEFVVATVQPENQGAGFDAVTFLHRQQDDTAADFGRKPNVGRLDVTRCPNLVFRWLLRAAHHGDDEHEQNRGAHVSVLLEHSQRDMLDVSRQVGM